MTYDKIPFIAIGEEELNGYLRGTHIKCPHCGDNHVVEYGTSKTEGVKTTTSTLGFYKCGDDGSYLATIKGKLLRGVMNADT